MSFACFLLTIYCIGLILIPIGFGIWKYDVVRNFETDDYIIACFMLAIWPLVAFFGFGFALSFGIIYSLSYVFSWPFKAGAWFREYLIGRKAEKLEKAEPGDKGYSNDHVCD